MWGSRIALALVALGAAGSLAYALRYFEADLPSQAEAAERLTGGDAARGKEALRTFGCVSCHVVAGLRGGGRIGPSLESFQKNLYLAGSLPNRADVLIAWIRHPTELRPGTAMPDCGLTPTAAKDVAAFLYSQP
jgi:cytochrome c